MEKQMNEQETLIKELRAEALALGVPQEKFSVGKRQGKKDEIWHYIEPKVNGWEVGTIERALVYDVKIFQGFAKAKKYFIGLLLDYLEFEKLKHTT